MVLCPRRLLTRGLGQNVLYHRRVPAHLTQTWLFYVTDTALSPGTQFMMNPRDMDSYGLRKFHSSSPMNIPGGFQDPSVSSTIESFTSNSWDQWNSRSPLEDALNTVLSPPPENASLSSWSPDPLASQLTPPATLSPSSPLVLNVSTTDASSSLWDLSSSPILTSPIWTPTKSDVNNLHQSALSLASVRKDLNDLSLFSSDELPNAWTASARAASVPVPPSPCKPKPSFPIGVWQNLENTSESSQATSNYRYNQRRGDQAMARRPGASGHSTDGGLFCNYCKTNNECELVYRSHRLHQIDAQGNRLVSCPILYKVVCSECGATGVHAHSKAYCPYRNKGSRVDKKPLVRTLLEDRTSSNTRRSSGPARSPSTPSPVPSVPGNMTLRFPTEKTGVQLDTAPYQGGQWSV
ncbi:hypothetical protein WDU94_010104 [Cyamophila willieti]